MEPTRADIFIKCRHHFFHSLLGVASKRVVTHLFARSFREWVLFLRAGLFSFLRREKKCRQIAEQTRKDKLPEIQTSYLWEVFCSSSWLKNVRRSGSELRLLKNKQNTTWHVFILRLRLNTKHFIASIAKPEIWIRLEVQTTFVCDTYMNSPQNLMHADWLAQFTTEGTKRNDMIAYKFVILCPLHISNTAAQENLANLHRCHMASYRVS